MLSLAASPIYPLPLRICDWANVNRFLLESFHTMIKSICYLFSLFSSMPVRVLLFVNHVRLAVVFQ